MFDEKLGNILNQSFQFAKDNKDEYVTTEHLFLSILDDDYSSQIFEDLGLDIEKAIVSIKKYINENVPKIENELTSFTISETTTVINIINMMLLHIESSGKVKATTDDLLVALFHGEKSYTVYYLSKYNISEFDMVNYVTIKGHPESKSKPISKEEKQEKSYLDIYTQNIVSLAKENKIDPVIGRDNEINIIMQTLCKRKKNNPLIVGETGVGKTAVVEGLALKIANNDIPEVLKGYDIFLIDIASMVAGTKYRGEFEKRLKGVMNELEQRKNAILFIDEIHNIIGAGSASGSMDAANILKPLLAGGSIKCIGTTTYNEYKKFFDKEKALSRRFEKIDITETDRELTLNILNGLLKKYEEFHDIKYTQDALEKAVDLSMKYINNRFLPDKAIDLIDEAGASFRLKTKNRKSITGNDIEELIARKMKIPSKVIKVDERKNLKDLDKKLKQRIFGQDEAIKHLVAAIKRNKAGLQEIEKPMGSFLFTGPSGVGKTALSKELAAIFSIHFERFDMSEYMEKHTASRLIGAPAGYVGYEEGGLLTEVARKHPYMVLLLDEVEKAHPDVLNILLQIMDSSNLTDTSGVKVNFKNVIIIMTSNLGSKEMNQIGFLGTDKGGKNSQTAVKKFFSPEFRNRLDAIVNFASLNSDIMMLVVKKFISDLEKILKTKNVTISIDKKTIKYLAEKGYSTELGARPLQRIIQEEIKTPLTDELLFGKLSKGGKAIISLKGKDEIVFKFE